MNQRSLDINQEAAALMSQGKWRNCQRKKYNVYAILPPAGFVFANRLEQPKQYKYIMSRFKKAIVSINRLTTEDKHILGNNCYITDGTMVVLMGTVGEMWTVKPDKFINSYVNTDGTIIADAPKQWKEYSRAEESAPSAKGMQIPVSYIAKYDAGWGILTMNDMDSPISHGKGDILVVSLDGQSVSTVNNTVFALTFNQNIGGWSQSGLINSPQIASKYHISIDEARLKYGFDDVAENQFAVDELCNANTVENRKKEALKMVKEYLKEHPLHGADKTTEQQNGWLFESSCRGGNDYDDPMAVIEVTEDGYIKFWSESNGRTRTVIAKNTKEFLENLDDFKYSEVFNCYYKYVSSPYEH